MKCVKCGTARRGDAPFCAECGSKFLPPRPISMSNDADQSGVVAESVGSVADRRAMFGESVNSTNSSNSNSNNNNSNPIVKSSRRAPPTSTSPPTSTTTSTSPPTTKEKTEKTKKSGFLTRLFQSTVSMMDRSGSADNDSEPNAVNEIDDGDGDDDAGGESSATTRRKWFTRALSSGDADVADPPANKTTSGSALPPARPKQRPPRSRLTNDSLNATSWKSVATGDTPLSDRTSSRHSTHNLLAPSVWIETAKAHSSQRESSPVASPVLRDNSTSSTSSVSSAASISSTSASARVLQELVETERDYVRDLDLLCTLYVRPLSDGEMISEADHAQLFANVEQVLILNRSLLERLSAAQSVGEVGAMFLSMSDYLKSYSAYCCNQNRALDTLTRLKEKNREFASFADYCLARPEARGLPLAAFLVKPLQRICKYPLLLRELVKRLPEGSTDHKTMTLALQKIEATVAVVNERQRDFEHSAKMFDIFKSVAGCPPGCDILSPTRRFMREFDAKMVFVATAGVQTSCNTPVHCFLFNDAILVCKAKRKEKYQLVAFVSLESACVRASLTKDTIMEVGDVPLMKIWALMFDSGDERDDILLECLTVVEKFLEDAVSSANESRRESRRLPVVPEVASPSSSSSPTAAPAARVPNATTGRTMPNTTSYQSVPQPPPKSQGTTQYSAMPAQPRHKSPPARPSAELIETRVRRNTELQTQYATLTKDEEIARINVAPLLRKQVVPANEDEDDDDDEAAVSGGDSIALSGRYHDEVVEIVVPRSEFTFVNVRKLLHEAHKLAVPRPFVVLKCRQQRVMTDADLTRALDGERALQVDVFE